VRIEERSGTDTKEDQNVKRQNRILGWAVLTVATVMMVNGALAATWDGGAGTTNWFDGDNWNPNGVLDTNVTAQILNGGFTVGLTATAGTGQGQASQLQIDYGSTLTVRETRVSPVDETLLINNGNGLRLGANNGTRTGELHVASGNVVISAASGDTYRDSSGIIRVSGGSLTMQAGGVHRFCHRNGSHDQIIVSGGSFTNLGRSATEGGGSFSLAVSGNGQVVFAGSHFDIGVTRSADADPDEVNFTIADNALLRVTATFGPRFGVRASGTVNIVQSGGTFEAGTDVLKKNLVLADIGSTLVSYTISGGTLDASQDVSCGDGDNGTNIFHVIGTNGAVDVARNLSVGSTNATMKFSLDADGVSPIQVATGGSGTLTINTAATLELDFSSFTFSTNVVELFDYSAGGLSGAFGATNLSGGVRSLEIDYDYMGQKKVVAKSFKRPPDGTLFWQK
jgi:hypothetical protein